MFTKNAWENSKNLDTAAERSFQQTVMSSQQSTTILGIDPGYDRLGWAVGVLEAGKVRLLGYDSIRTRKGVSLAHRYTHIISELDNILSQYQPSEVAIESVFFSKNQTTAMQVSEVRGVIIGCVLRHGCRYTEYNPNHIKLAVTGYGKADKQAVEKMMRLQLHLSSDEKLLDDTADALGILLTHAVSAKSRLLSHE